MNKRKVWYWIAGGLAMLAPVAVIRLLCSLGVGEYLPWLAGASGLAMYFGMLAAMLYRRDHFTGKAGHLYMPLSW